MKVSIDMPKTLGIVSIKGGVGKTTISSSLAADLSNHFGKKVLLVDANFSAPNLGLHMDIVRPEKTIHHVLDRKTRINSAIQNKFGVDILPGEYVYNNRINYLKLKDHLKQIKNNYDFIIIDSSPSLNDEVLSTILASDKIFVVTTPDYPTISCSLKAAKLAKQRGKPISGIIINKIRDPAYELSLKEIELTTNIPVVSRIPDDKSTTRALFTRIPVSVYNKKTGFSKEISKLSAALTNSKMKYDLLKRIFPISMKKEEVNRQLMKKEFYKRSFEE